VPQSPRGRGLAALATSSSEKRTSVVEVIGMVIFIFRWLEFGVRRPIGNFSTGTENNPTRGEAS
jgi:hypothetical protein